MKNKAKEYLSQIRKNDILIQRKKDIINELNQSLILKGVSFDNIPSSSNLNIKRQEHTINKLISLKDELNEDIEKMLLLKDEVMKVIDSLNNPDEINLLYLRYFEFKKWEEIAYLMHFTYRYVHMIHSNALQNVEKIINKKEV